MCVQQIFRLNMEGQIGVGERCIDMAGSGLQMIYCPVQPTGPWSWDKGSGLIRYKQMDRCVGVENNKLALRPCDLNDKSMQWDFEELYTWRR